MKSEWSAFPLVKPNAPKDYLCVVEYKYLDKVCHEMEVWSFSTKDGFYEYENEEKQAHSIVRFWRDLPDPPMHMQQQNEMLVKQIEQMGGVVKQQQNQIVQIETARQVDKEVNKNKNEMGI